MKFTYSLLVVEKLNTKISPVSVSFVYQIAANRTLSKLTREVEAFMAPEQMAALKIYYVVAGTRPGDFSHFCNWEFAASCDWEPFCKAFRRPPSGGITFNLSARAHPTTIGTVLALFPARNSPSGIRGPRKDREQTGVSI